MLDGISMLVLMHKLEPSLEIMVSQDSAWAKPVFVLVRICQAITV